MLAELVGHELTEVIAHEGGTARAGESVKSFDLAPSEVPIPGSHDELRGIGIGRTELLDQLLLSDAAVHELNIGERPNLIHRAHEGAGFLTGKSLIEDEIDFAELFRSVHKCRIGLGELAH